MAKITAALDEWMVRSSDVQAVRRSVGGDTRPADRSPEGPRWRPRDAVLLPAIMLVGLGLRLQGIGFGAPADRCRWDEQFAVVEAICRAGGDPHLREAYAELAMEPRAWPELELHAYHQADVLETISRLEGDFLIVFVESFHEYYSWVPATKSLMLQVARDTGVRVELLRRWSPFSDGVERFESDYDRSDLWYIPLGSTEGLAAPGPAIEVHRVRRAP